MSIKLPSGPTSNDPSLRLIKQKVKRAGQQDSVQHVGHDNDRPSTHKSERSENLSPQPPSFPRNDDSRTPTRHHELINQSSIPGKGFPEVNSGTQSRKNGATDTAPESNSKSRSIDGSQALSTKLGGTANQSMDIAPPMIDMSLHEVGLDNLGNTCFMNSILQCLLHVEPLIQFFLRPNLESNLNLASPKKGALALSFRQLVHDVYKKRSSTSVSPASIQKAVCAHAPYLMDYQQQDSQEFLRFLLDGMSEDLCRKHSEQQESNIAGESTTSPGLNLRSSLPLLPQSSVSPATSSGKQKSSGVLEFSRTLPTNLHSLNSGSTDGTVHSISAQNSPVPARTSVHTSTTQKLREETRLMRQDENTSSSAQQAPSSTKANMLKSQSVSLSAAEPHAPHHHPNQGDGEALQPFQNNHQQQPQHPQQTPSKYVSRLRKFSAASPDQGEQISVFTPTDSRMSAQKNTASAPPNNSTSSTPAETSRVSALLRSADEGEDFSPVDDAEDPLRLSISSQDHFNTSVSHNNNLEESAEFAEEMLSRRIRRKPTRRLSRHEEELNTPTSNNPASNAEADQLALMLSQNCALRSLSSTLLQRLLNSEKEARLAWNKYLKLNDSVITDLFAGQLQSTIECMTCHHRSSSYDPFLDLSVPIIRDCDLVTPAKSTFLGSIRSGVNSISGSSGNGENKSTLERCLEKFTAEETLEGENMYTCEKCKAKRKSVKQLSIYKYPTVLVIHIKRFKYNSTRREKLSTDVHFPLTGLDLTPFISSDLLPLLPQAQPSIDNSTSSVEKNSAKITPRSDPGLKTSANNTAPYTTNSTPPAPVYDLIGVSNHHGSLHSGHYIAHVDTTGGRADKARRWMCFNDSRVTPASLAGIAGPTAYVLFYKLQQS